MCYSKEKPRVHSGIALVRFVVNEMELEQVFAIFFFRVPPTYKHSVIAPIHHRSLSYAIALDQAARLYLQPSALLVKERGSY
jgi:hypothetical protein